MNSIMMTNHQKLPSFQTLQLGLPQINTTPSPQTLVYQERVTLPPISNLNLPLKGYQPASISSYRLGTDPNVGSNSDGSSVSSSCLGHSGNYTLNSQLMSPNSQAHSSPNTPKSPIGHYHSHHPHSDNYDIPDNENNSAPLSKSSTPEYHPDAASNTFPPRKLQKVTDPSSQDSLSLLYSASLVDSDSDSQSEHKGSETIAAADTITTTAAAAANPRKWKPRKKRQCPECKLFFSNLATHKSTHLNPDSRPHICEYCSRGFARPNDLFRHVKCHWKEIGSDKGQFKCPYKNHPTGDHCGHSSGIFSRCDTFKNHLKAIHFQYPSGTKKDQRSKANGSCRICQQSFESVDDWLVDHIENNQCPYANEYKKS